MNFISIKNKLKVYNQVMTIAERNNISVDMLLRFFESNFKGIKSVYVGKHGIECIEEDGKIIMCLNTK